MEDVHNAPARLPLAVDRVGLKNLELPIVVRDRAQGSQHTVARVDVGADLPAAFKGTHMSRFVAALENRSEKLDYGMVKRLLEDIKRLLHARKAYAVFRFPYFIRKQAPVSGRTGLVSYSCSLTGELESDTLSFLLELSVPVITVCPCSKAISAEGAHSQRAEVRMAVRMTGFSWLEEFIDIAEAAASSPVYTFLNRADEKYVTERAFASPAFVEDVVRSVAHALSSHTHVSAFRVEVESFESIHAHNAFAVIEGHGAAGGA
jgi:GTP cyclohydrolase I